jgi:hypothetical protein
MPEMPLDLFDLAPEIIQIIGRMVSQLYKGEC